MPIRLHSRWGACGLAAALALPGSAWSGAVAVARLDHLQFTLVDLAPDDGIAPSFSFVADPDAPNRQRTELTVDVQNSVLGTSDSAIQADFSFIAPLDLARSVANNSAIARSTADSLHAEATSLERGSASAFASSESNVFFSGDFGLQLSPMSAITITADATVTALDTGEAGAEGFAFEFAQAESFLRIRAADPGDGSGPQDSLSQRSAVTTVDALADVEDASGALSVSFQNLGAAPLYGYLSARSTASAFGVTAAVPEPSSWALALTGLAALAARGRRRAGREPGALKR
ncbi:PEP-CTERM sorting domain-containing protein [Aquabacterium sp. A7-Y]|uniref:PEP-CTERM sorting domain-containing protein n=1 Tax=Aquabacterium sp. A7-Y TaxID=1349605 RepID=UPI00223DF9FC|nr:PEP-CTERM sorting domain-containing protein [Aquabacterium sp. A7-Y]MCW7538053.1 PEP-CTERM sorting domain-containing protein [Aquabacterium sp. A7-Y]